jgi:hypothetical protein
LSPAWCVYWFCRLTPIAITMLGFTFQAIRATP